MKNWIVIVLPVVCVLGLLAGCKKIEPEPVFEFYFLHDTHTMKAGDVDTLEYRVRSGTYVVKDGYIPHILLVPFTNYEREFKRSTTNMEVFWMSSNVDVADVRRITPRGWGSVAQGRDIADLEHLRGEAIITAKAAGETVITVLARHGGATITCNVTVVE